MMELLQALAVVIGIPLQIAAACYSTVLVSRRQYRIAAYYLVLAVYILLLTRGNS